MAGRGEDEGRGRRDTRANRSGAAPGGHGPRSGLSGVPPSLGGAQPRSGYAPRTGSDGGDRSGVALDAVLPFIQQLRRAASPGVRLLLAVAGPPASGKSTLVTAIVDRLGAEAAILPMDGFHLDNALLDTRGLRSRKGAPATFDVAGFASMLTRVRSDRGSVLVPTFDRRLDLARAGAAEIGSRHRIVVVEGNYLLLDEAPWSAIARLYDASIFLAVPESVIEERILARWRRYGLDDRAARTRALENDVPNARHVLRGSAPADLTLDERGWPVTAAPGATGVRAALRATRER